MNIALLLISDSRFAYFEKTINSANRCLPKFDHRVMIDDADHKLGFAGAIQEGWAQVLATKADWVLHLECDFTFNGEVPVSAMVELLRRYPYLAQVALKRQAWSEEEKAAGGVIERRPDAFHECRDKQAVWTEHRLFFTTNPSVYSTRICRLGWPQLEGSEMAFTKVLLEDHTTRFAIWGAKDAPPTVTHIGEERVGHGY